MPPHRESGSSALINFILSSFVGCVGFNIGYNAVDPTSVTNAAVSFAADLSLTSLDEEASDSSAWILRKAQQLNRNILKVGKEDEYHRSLMKWDHDFPDFNHKKLVRGAAGLIVSQVFLSIFSTLRGGRR